ncbi:hypothetical protein CDL15_Pgr028868 [Punica granatum]|uniref:Uncharacterized protein n=1 Tax=Punica granatum TaxID=22663 RepID=A0A218WYE5_PUNGR|nr:hypothetical protein CDL15_Pgr028868 [Punica granatum]
MESETNAFSASSTEPPPVDPASSSRREEGQFHQPRARRNSCECADHPCLLPRLSEQSNQIASPAPPRFPLFE